MEKVNNILHAVDWPVYYATKDRYESRAVVILVNAVMVDVESRITDKLNEENQND